MRYLFLLIFILSIGCNSNNNDFEKQYNDCLVVSDSAVSVINRCTVKLLTVVEERDSLQKLCNTLHTKIFLIDYKLQKIDFYIRLCIKDKRKDKYLKRWCRRVLQ